MFLFGILSSIFWAVVVTIILWVLCAFSGKLVNASYSMPALLHLLCFAVAVPTIVFLVVDQLCRQITRAHGKMIFNM
jgi:predicted PurR-regulated permease PerM